MVKTDKSLKLRTIVKTCESEAVVRASKVESWLLAGDCEAVLPPPVRYEGRKARLNTSAHTEAPFS